MIAVLLLAAATPQTAVDAERAFAADALKLGQWTAFRKWAAPDAVMFVPQPINAQAWLKNRKNPARSVRWWPVASYLSCDGTVAVNTGGWKRPDGSVGYFSTVWRRQHDGRWKWIVDEGDTMRSVTPAITETTAPTASRALCGKEVGAAYTAFMMQLDERAVHGGDKSEDRTLRWDWTVNPDGERWFGVSMSTADPALSMVVNDLAAAPKPK